MRAIDFSLVRILLRCLDVAIEPLFNEQQFETSLNKKVS